MGRATRAARLGGTPPLARLPRSLPEVPLIPRSFVRAALVAAALAVLPALASAAGPAPAGAAPAKATPAAPQGEFTILYGDNHAFGITPPPGWTVDDTSGLGSKIRVVLYPKGQKWASAATVMYVNPLHQKAGTRRTLLEMIAHDATEFAKRAPKGRVTAAAPIKTGKAKSAEVRYFAPDGGAPTEAVAYVPEDDLVMLLVLSSRDAAGFKRHLPAFQSVVASYQFVAGGIETPR